MRIVTVVAAESKHHAHINQRETKYQKNNNENNSASVNSYECV